MGGRRTLGAGNEVTIHAHGTPITPRARLLELAGCHFCVSFAAPEQVEVCHKIGQSVMLDNGAFTFWNRGTEMGPGWWDRYYEWCEPWLDIRTTWAVIPDVIDGTEEENDRLLAEWHLTRLPRGAPVWHLNESIERLVRLSVGYQRICLGSSGEYRDVGSPAWHRRMEQVFNAVCVDGVPRCDVHMLRGMAQCSGPYPFTSVDSSDIAQNHHRPQNDVVSMARRWDSIQCPSVWVPREQLALEAVA